MEQRVEEIFLPLYQQLRAIAQAKLAGNESATLQATSVVHEALIRLSKRPADSFTDEQHMLACAAQAIRHVIVDHARRKRADERVDLDEQASLFESATGLSDSKRVDLVIDLDRAMDSLSNLDSELRTIVEFHAFGGMSHAEVAQLLNTSERTVRRRWLFAAALLRRELHEWADTTDERQACE